MKSTQHFNGLTETELERLALLSEEMGESQQIIGKILRHGYESYHPDDPGTSNRTLLQRELGDVRFAIKLMCDRGDFVEDQIEGRSIYKEKKIGQYLHHNEIR